MQTTNQLHEFGKLQVQIVNSHAIILQELSTTVIDFSTIDKISNTRASDIVDVFYKSSNAFDGLELKPGSIAQSRRLYGFLSAAFIDYIVSKQPSLI